MVEILLGLVIFALCVAARRHARAEHTRKRDRELMRRHLVARYAKTKTL